jgi:hypothetical protein
VYEGMLCLFYMCKQICYACLSSLNSQYYISSDFKGADDIAHHKEQPHYAAWVAFKESGGTISSVSKKASGKFMT